MRLSRRFVLRAAGVSLALPALESLAPSTAKAAPEDETFAIFFRQANGVAQAQRTELGDEPERFWPRNTGALTDASLSGRALEELGSVKQHLLVVGGLDMQGYDYGDGHARGALQCLTARGPTVLRAGGDSEAAGESIDHRIGRELNPGGRDSLFLYAGRAGGWLGGACISYRGPAQRRAALNNPLDAYRAITGSTSGGTDEAARLSALRQRGVDDLVRGQMSRILAHPRLSTTDRRRLELHRDSIRDVEITLSCRMTADQERALEGAAPGFDSTDGDETLESARLHMDIAALAVACGYTRSVAIQVGNGNDGSTRFRHSTTRVLMENYHYISHRRLSHDSSGGIIAGADALHGDIDRQFARTFLHLVNRLRAITQADGTPLLDRGVACWLNDLSNGPPHGRNNVPWVLAGSANGFLRQGQYVVIDDSDPNHNKLLNTIGSAVGLRNGAGYLDNFGDPALPRGVLDELVAT
ncbi:DUF1552 domain-containing protein [Sandaracinus amylolyticus]|uniref:DUF1552 domain-containing protein n=1 Tax=Sandaracinus amylolyticus TaxID=927083 RepID=UPI001F3B3C29|nr:DUF1552 domain-containing protein [Sandaracinus amylolyticus]UJR83328.1 Hypothetical protein I5071_53960 [Sandaracinus amylolyticus]